MRKGGAQGEVEVELDHATSEGGDPVGGRVREHPGYSPVMVTRISAGKVAQEEVHGRVEVGVNKDHDSGVVFLKSEDKAQEGPIGRICS